MRTRRASTQRRTGAAIVEAALVLPIAILFIFGILEYGRFLFVRNVMEHGAREGARYAVVGSGLGVSEPNGIGQPEPGTLEALLTRLGEPGVFIPTHKGKGLPVSEIAALPTRSGSIKNSTYFALTPASLADFDWFVVLASTTYGRGGPPLP